MKRRILVLLLVLSMGAIFAACDDSEDIEIAEKESTGQVAEENTTASEPEEEKVEWDKVTVGPMEFEAPISWQVSDSYFYSPPGPEGESSGYYLSVNYNENRNGNIEFFVERDLDQYEDVDLEYIDVLGYDAARLKYECLNDGKLCYNIMYYIQIYPESGLGMINYEAPAAASDYYMADFERLFNSLSIKTSEESQESNVRSFILNMATGTFHKPSCYKVKQIETSLDVTSNYEDMISKGYKGCEICTP